jgi:chemotaxis protein MotB
VLLLDVVAQSLSLVENKISIVGHTDSLPYSSGRDYTNWELSTDRAHAARRLMIAAGLSKTQVNEVAGKADSEPLVEDRFAPQNRRISITILKS